MTQKADNLVQDLNTIRQTHQYIVAIHQTINVAIEDINH